MLSSKASTITSDESFITPVSSMGDLMALSPKKSDDFLDISHMTNDILTGTDFDSICDETMREIPAYDNNMFIDATSLDYLDKCAESNRNPNFLDRGKESLYVKFDPLYAQKQQFLEPYQAEIQADSLEYDVGYETSSSTSILTDNMTGKADNTFNAGAVQNKCGKDKPMQVVSPVVSCEIPKNTAAQTKPTPVLVRSVSAILTPTQVATDRLISISGNTPPVAAPRSPRLKHYGAQENDRLQSLRAILQNQDHEVLQLRQENRELRSSLQDLEHNFARYKEDMELKLKKLTEDKINLLDKEIKLTQQINDKELNNKKMCIVMEEYEKTISTLIGEQQQEKVQYLESLDKLVKERDQAVKHLNNMESSFNDLLTKYEKCKSVVLEAKDRENIFNKKIADYEIGLQKYEALYNNLKQTTSDSLEKANETLENLKKNHSVEITKMNATMKKHEIMISSLQESLAQKTRDNEELTRICDQLINEVR
ncbi:myosin-7-like [Zerene cesonia]|uniref:myosin-7-like n=1 Tax=Zerene cesonia TaxID=33412 RepID=UPI0018E57994|nr:myosin-7-like [Zerene cesonia]